MKLILLSLLCNYNVITASFKFRRERERKKTYVLKYYAYITTQR